MPSRLLLVPVSSNATQFLVGVEIILDETEAWSLAIGLPKIEVAVLIPVVRNDGPAVLNKVEAADGRDISEAFQGSPFRS